MIPLKLQIKNFLSYGSESQTIDFEPYNLICLSGKNGHGKSALLDAMTWAIWGEARKSSGLSKPDQGLLRLGQRQMMVIFDFEFNKNQYRVRREFTFAYGKPYAYLEFGIFENIAEDKLVSLTDKTIKTTQAKIETMIGLSYDSFVNSAFLKQGSSNEFSKKSPKERKEILANILGLDKYETLRKLALEKIKQDSSKKDGILKLQEHIEKELSVYEEIKINLLQVKEEFEKIFLLENENVEVKEKINDEKNKISSFIQEAQLLNFQFSKLKENKNQKTEQLQKIYLNWKQAHRKKIALSNQKNLEIEKQKLIKIIENYQKQFEQKLECKEQFLKYKEQEQIFLKQLNDKFNLLMQEKKISLERLLVNSINVQDKINYLEKEKNSLSKEIKKIDSETENLKNSVKKNIDENLIVVSEKQFEKRKNFYQQLINQGNWVKTELSSLEQKKKLSFDEHNPSCPLCEQNLSASRKKFLKFQFTKQEKFLTHRLKRIGLLIAKLKEILLQQHDEIKLHKQIVEQYKFVNLKIEEIKKSKEKIINQHNEISIQLTESIKNFDEIKEQIKNQNIEIEQIEQNNKIILENDAELKKIKSSINDLENKLNQNIYDSEAHKKTVAQLEQVELILSESQNLFELSLAQEQRKNEISQLCASIKLLKNEIKQIESKISSFKNLESQEIELKNKEAEHQQKIKELSKQKDLLLHKQGSLENQKAKLEQLALDHKGQKKIISQLDESIEEYKAISVALSKDGIQALLIEDAIPEIENEANELLAKLTDNQAQIFIESLRDLKKGGTKETLDIKISDGSGIRPYEMFSGGEAFRIDFALRIAISKLLARRAGTSLQTLIIDEGFGSQDEDGLTHIMDSIYKIQEDFEKIIIVSHLPSMKDQFPVHFVVEKGPAGSKVKILEQG